jgi:hypothetical protein
MPNWKLNVGDGNEIERLYRVGEAKFFRALSAFFPDSVKVCAMIANQAQVVSLGPRL